MNGAVRWQAELVVDAHARLGEGPVWCAGEAVLYWVDIDLGRVHRYDPATGTDAYLDLGGPVGAVVPTRSGGLALAALWNGWAVRRYRPDGTILAVVDVPCARVTKCAFGGPALDQLYITTASPDEPAPDQPHAGGLFRVFPGVTGLPSTPFAR